MKKISLFEIGINETSRRNRMSQIIMLKSTMINSFSGEEKKRGRKHREEGKKEKKRSHR